MKIKKVCGIFIILVMIFVFVGCSNVKVRTDVNVNIDGSINSLFKVSYDKSLENIFNNGLIKSIIKDGNIEVEKIKSGNVIEESVKYNTEKLSGKNIIGLIAASSFMKEKEIENDYVKIKIERKPGLLKNNFSVRIMAQEDYFNELEKTIDDKVIENALVKSIIGNAKTRVGEIPCEIKISLPFKIVDSNGSSQINNNEVLWEYNLMELSNGAEINFTFQAINIITLCCSIVILIIIVIVVVIKVKGFVSK